MPSTLSIGLWLRELLKHIGFIDHCYQPGASSIINIPTVKITEVFPCSFWVITMFFSASRFFFFFIRLLTLKNSVKLILSFFFFFWNSVHRITLVFSYR